MITQIINNTLDLKTYYFQRLCEDQLFDLNVDFVVRRVPSSVESLTWEVNCDDEDSRDVLRRTISGCSGSLCALSIVQSVDISHFALCQSISFEFQKHFKLAFWEGRETDIRDLLQSSAVTHVITTVLRMENA